MAGLGALNMSIMLPSLAEMARYFETEYAFMQLSVSAYLAVTAMLQVIVGPLSDKLGRRPVVLTAIGIFSIVSLAAAFAPTAEVFLACRLAQGVIVTGLVMSRAIVRDMVPQAQAASMIGYVTMGMALIPMIGPMVGGALQQAAGWQSIFLFCSAAGLIVLVICFRDQGETVRGEGMSFSEQLRTYPELLTSPRFWGYVACASFASGAFFAYLGGGSFVASEVYGLSPFWAGAGLGAPAIGYAAGNFFSGRFSVRMGSDRMILIGTLVATLGMGTSLTLGVTGLATHPLVFFGMCSFMGLGNGLTMPNSMAGMLSVRPHLAGTASGLGGAIMIAGGACLSAFSGTLLDADRGAIPLQWIMFISSAMSILAILFVFWRARQIKAS